MNKKLIFAGGEPDISIDDLDRNPEADRLGLFGAIRALAGDNNAVVSGAVVTVTAGVSASVTAGYIWLDSELLQVDAQTVPETQTTDLWEFQKVVTYDAFGDKTFNDATPRQTWQKNRAVLVNVASITGVNAAALLGIFDLELFAITSVDTNPDLTITTSTAYATLDKYGRVALKGYVTVVGTTAVPLMSLFSVPSALKPVRATGFGASATLTKTTDDISFANFANLILASDGSFTAQAGASAAGKYYLDGVSYFI